jgi:hypothetical protein
VDDERRDGAGAEAGDGFNDSRREASRIATTASGCYCGHHGRRGLRPLRNGGKEEERRETQRDLLPRLTWCFFTIVTANEDGRLSEKLGAFLLQNEVTLEPGSWS